jgi:membrane protease YdiL (CAAX protease family)
MVAAARIALAVTVLCLLAARTDVCAYVPLSQLHSFRNHLSSSIVVRRVPVPVEASSSAVSKRAIRNGSSRAVLRLQSQDSTRQSSSSIDGFTTPPPTPSTLLAKEGEPYSQQAGFSTEGSVQTAATVIGQQGLLIPVALVLGQLLGTTPFELQIDGPSLSYGLLAVLPLALMAVALDAVEDRFPALTDVTVATQRAVLLFLGGSFRPVFTCVAAMGIGLAAGFGEELLFRGVFQTKLVEALLPMAATANVAAAMAILLSSLAFGALHAVTPMYVLLATLASVYFGYLLVAFDGNLTVPIVCHAVYDFGALVYAHWEIGQMTDEEKLALLQGPVQTEVEQ